MIYVHFTIESEGEEELIVVNTKEAGDVAGVSTPMND